ncbi:MAG: hypothetical protein ACREM1_20690 [Longimicrobiales bacterium]
MILFSSVAVLTACAGENSSRAPADTTPPDSAAPAESTALAPDPAADPPNGDIVARFRQRIPENLLLRRGACPFECCIYRNWEATGEIPVVAQERGTAPPVFTIDAGERFRADSGNVHVTSIAVVPVTDSVGDPPYWSFGPGDTLVVLDYVGEGFYNVWHDGSVVEVPTFWSSGPIEEGEGSLGQHAAEWWVHITMSDGRTGWIRADTAPQINGADACG